MTIRTIDANRPDITPYLAYRNYYTFRLIKGKFYLHQYSQEVFNYQDYMFASSLDNKKNAKLLTTQIFYRQSRDDPEGKNPISMQDFFHNPQRVDLEKTPLLMNLRQQCFAKHLCEQPSPKR